MSISPSHTRAGIGQSKRAWANPGAVCLLAGFLRRRRSEIAGDTERRNFDASREGPGVAERGRIGESERSAVVVHVVFPSDFGALDVAGDRNFLFTLAASGEFGIGLDKVACQVALIASDAAVDVPIAIEAGSACGKS